MRTAIVHDWIVDIGGSEKCLESIYSLYPSDVYTLVFKEQSAVSLGIDLMRLKGSFLQKFPQATKRYRTYLPFFPLAVEQFDLSGYDVIISSSHAAAKGVLTTSEQLHICYCYTPMRYAWDLYHQYLKEAGLEKGLKGKIAKAILHYIRIWDYSTSNRVDHFIAISEYIARRIKKVYGRDAVVIYPPVDIDKYELYTEKENYYLTASRMVPYKKIDLIVESFKSMPDKKLVVIGDGPDFKKIKSKAGENIELLGYQSFNVLKEYMQRAKAFVFAAEEDFGIIPVEAQACGTPVIAYGRGGVMETIVPMRIAPTSSGQAPCGMRNEKHTAPTGVFFYEQTVESLIGAVRQFEENQDRFDYALIRKNAERFSRERFRMEFRKFVESKLRAHQS